MKKKYGKKIKTLYGKSEKKTFLKILLKKESKLVCKSSMEILKELEAIND